MSLVEYLMFHSFIHSLTIFINTLISVSGPVVGNGDTVVKKKHTHILKFLLSWNLNSEEGSSSEESRSEDDPGNGDK